MRATNSPPLLSLLLLLLLPFTLAVWKDDAYTTDWHRPLLGPSLPQSTFFHAPTTDSKATLIYTLSTRGILAALNPKDGEIVWRQDLSRGNARGVAKAGEGVIVAAVGTNIAAFDAAKGRLLWEREVAADVIDLEILALNGVATVLRDGMIKTFMPDGADAWERAAKEK